MPVTTSTSTNTQGSGSLTLFGLVFAIPGIAVGVSTLRKVIAGTIDVKQTVLGFTMALMFVGAGIALIVWSRVSARIAARNREAMDQNPDKPWLWRDDWAQGYARAEWKSTAGIMTVIGAAFLLFSVPMLMNLPATLLREHPFQTSLVLLFPLGGVFLIGQSTLALCRRRNTPGTCGGGVCISTGNYCRTHAELRAFVRIRFRGRQDPLGANSLAGAENAGGVDGRAQELHPRRIHPSLRRQRDRRSKSR